jgi:hypothetical protein
MQEKKRKDLEVDVKLVMRLPNEGSLCMSESHMMNIKSRMISL